MSNEYLMSFRRRQTIVNYGTIKISKLLSTQASICLLCTNLLFLCERKEEAHVILILNKYYLDNSTYIPLRVVVLLLRAKQWKQ